MPNLGVVRKPTGDGTVFADIPGLIEGAHTGVGLGHEFLRHIERTRLLLHLIDATADDPIADYQTIQKELSAYGRGLLSHPQLLVLNKIDAADPDSLTEVRNDLGSLSPVPIFSVSAVTRTGLEIMMQAVWDQLEQT